MKKAVLFCALGIAALAAAPARADQFSFSFSGPSVDRSNQFSFSGSGTLYADYSGVADIWTIESVSGTVTTESYNGRFTAPSSTTYDIGGLLPASPASGSFDGNDNLLYWPGGVSFSGADFFDTNGVSFSLVGSTNDINLDTAFVLIFPYDQGTAGSSSEAVSETICWQGPGDPPAATPEPSSLALLGTSILGGAGLLRRRFRA